MWKNHTIKTKQISWNYQVPVQKFPMFQLIPFPQSSQLRNSIIPASCRLLQSHHSQLNNSSNKQTIKTLKFYFTTTKNWSNQKFRSMRYLKMNQTLYQTIRSLGSCKTLCSNLLVANMIVALFTSKLEINSHRQKKWSNRTWRNLY